MRTWAEFAAAEPALAGVGEELFRAFTLGYLATVRPDGSPRVHPVTVTLHGGGLYISTVRGTRKAYDLRRDGRFALHAFPRLPDDSGWHDDEFMAGGRAEEVVDAAERRAVLEVHNDVVSPRDALWHLLLDRAMRRHRIDGRPRAARAPDRVDAAARAVDDARRRHPRERAEPGAPPTGRFPRHRRAGTPRARREWPLARRRAP